MVFSDSSGKQGIVEDIDFLLDMVDSGSTDYPIAHKTRNINSWYNKAVDAILGADGNWEWDDENYTSTRPIATTALVASQQDYSLAGEGILKILRVECKDKNGNWNKLQPISLNDKREVALLEYQKTAGDPREYDLLANSIFLYPKPSFASDGGLKIFYQRDFDHFTVSDTIQYPGFDPLFHRILSYGAALDYAVSKEMSGRISQFSNEIAKIEKAIVEHYSKKDRDQKVRFTLKRESYGPDNDLEPLSADWG